MNLNPNVNWPNHTNSCRIETIIAGMEHWSTRLEAAMADAGLSAAQLARITGLPADSIRKYRSGAVDQPRGDAFDRLANALGVEVLWLRDGIPPRAPGDMTLSDDSLRHRGEELLLRRGIAQRVAGARMRRGINTPEAAALGTIIPGLRWRQIERGETDATSLELRVISQRLRVSLDWVISEELTPIDDTDPVEAEKVRRYLQEKR